jgi:hypothetical protein
MPSEIAMEKNATVSGTTAATRAPKTRTRMTRAAGMPKKSSPVFRSSFRIRSRSESALHSPVIAASNSALLASRTIVLTESALSSQSPWRPMVISVACLSRETRLASSLE